MATEAKKLQPIIVRKVKKGGPGHHGGAWKIAYADFVTAMMAFFLLMWLLGSTTEGDKKGIADYFSSPLKIALLSSGSGAGDASHVVKGGGRDLTRTTGQVKGGEVEAPRKTVNLRALREEQMKAEAARLDELRRRIQARIDGSQRLATLKSQLRLEMTRDGLRIQIVDDQNRPMFASGSAIVQPYMRELLQAIGELLGAEPNRLTIEGHTDAMPYAGGDRGYGNWELSADRANASRRELIAGGLPEDRTLRVQGLAAILPLDSSDPAAAVNRRISILVMNREAEERFRRIGLEVVRPAGSEPEAESADVAADPAADPGAAADSSPSAAGR